MKLLKLMLPPLVLVVSVLPCGAGDVVIPSGVGTVMKEYCVDCHDGDEAEAGVRFDGMETMGKAAMLHVLNRVEAQLFFGMMPPEGKRQPSGEERRALFDWVQGELRRENASGLDAKRRAPEAGNWVDHDVLFGGGDGGGKAFTPGRRWGR